MGSQHSTSQRCRAGSSRLCKPTYTLIRAYGDSKRRRSKRKTANGNVLNILGLGFLRDLSVGRRKVRRREDERCHSWGGAGTPPGAHTPTPYREKVYPVSGLLYSVQYENSDDFLDILVDASLSISFKPLRRT
jgi:hypothetical protein